MLHLVMPCSVFEYTEQLMSQQNCLSSSYTCPQQHRFPAVYGFPNGSPSGQHPIGICLCPGLFAPPLWSRCPVGSPRITGDMLSCWTQTRSSALLAYLGSAILVSAKMKWPALSSGSRYAFALDRTIAPNIPIRNMVALFCCSQLNYYLLSAGWLHSTRTTWTFIVPIYLIEVTINKI